MVAQLGLRVAERVPKERAFGFALAPPSNDQIGVERFSSCEN
jgi:hypothetical protein